MQARDNDSNRRRRGDHGRRLLMASIRRLHAYPESFWHICEEVAVGRTVQRIEGIKRTEALALRQRFYGFRKALERELPKDEGWRVKVQQTLLWAMDVVPVVEGDGPTVDLCFMHKEMTAMARLLAKRQGAAL